MDWGAHHQAEVRECTAALDKCVAVQVRWGFFH
jgi:hypothetical protein